MRIRPNSNTTLYRKDHSAEGAKQNNEKSSKAGKSANQKNKSEVKDNPDTQAKGSRHQQEGQAVRGNGFAVVAQPELADGLKDSVQSNPVDAPATNGSYYPSLDNLQYNGSNSVSEKSASVNITDNNAQADEVQLDQSDQSTSAEVSTSSASNLTTLVSQTENLERQPVLFGTQLNLPGTKTASVQIALDSGLARPAQTNEADNEFSRIAPQDPSRAPDVNKLPNPRSISNIVMSETMVKPDPRGTSDLFWQWGQFLDHDVTLAAVAGEGGIIESAPISIPKGDEFLDPDGTGTKEIPFERSAFTLDENGNRQQINTLTPLVDGSQVYGSDSSTESELRSFNGGKLKTSSGNKLPLNEADRFVAGDERVNEQPGLTAMHTLFMREHNRLAKNIAHRNPHWCDEQVFQAAKAKNVAQMQAITYNEFLPTMLGEDSLQSYQGFDENAEASISTEFATAAYRFGHSMVTEDITLIRRNGKQNDLPISDNFENPKIIRDGNIGRVIRGQAFTPGNELDNEVSGSLRNLLFGPPGTPQGGLDLAALNIQRGRDHELSSYNDTRDAMGMRRITSWQDPIFRDGVGEKLSRAYEHPDDIDLWVGGLSESPDGDSSMGQTFTAINAQQFEQLRDSDPNYFENVFHGKSLERIQSTTLSDIIRRNSGVKDVQDDAFLTPGYV